jgi:hypothetical protein
MRYLLIAILLSGCGATPEQLLTGVTAVGVGSIAIIGRSPFDAAYSTLAGKDCSIVRLEQGKSYCRPVEPPPEPQPFCTRTLGMANCWRDPASLADHPTELGDGPHVLTPLQEADRTRAWLPL